MTHRTVHIDGTIQVEAFDTGLALQHWVKRNKADCIAVARGKFYFQRKDGLEMTIRLDPTDHPENRHLVGAANHVADEVEKLLEKTARENFLYGQDAVTGLVQA